MNDSMQCSRKILVQGGVVGLWRGCWPNVQRAALVNLGDLSTYDSVKTAILDNTGLQDNYVTHCMASGCAGLVFILFHNILICSLSRILYLIFFSLIRILSYHIFILRTLSCIILIGEVTISYHSH